MSLEEDLDSLEGAIRRIQIEWEKFFSGLEKKPPTEMRFQLEAVIRRHAHDEIRNNVLRFRYQTLVARYNTFNELWNKRLKAKEEGRPVGFHGSHLPAVVAAPAMAPPAARPAAAAARSGDVRLTDPGDGAAVQALFERFLAARQQTGESQAVKFDSFQKLIAQQASRILQEKGAQAVEFRLETKDGKVSLKAKPVK